MSSIPARRDPALLLATLNRAQRAVSSYSLRDDKYSTLVLGLIEKELRGLRSILELLGEVDEMDDGPLGRLEDSEVGLGGDLEKRSRFHQDATSRSAAVEDVSRNTSSPSDRSSGIRGPESNRALPMSSLLSSASTLDTFGKASHLVSETTESSIPIVQVSNSDQYQSDPAPSTPRKYSHRSVPSLSSVASDSEASSTGYKSSESRRRKESKRREEERSKAEAFEEGSGNHRRNRGGISSEARKALEMATAPASPILRSERSEKDTTAVIKRVIAVVAGMGLEGRSTLAALCRVSHQLLAATAPALYTTVIIDSMACSELLFETLSSNIVPSQLVKTIKILPDSDSDTRDYLNSIKKVVDTSPNLDHFEENMTSIDWDVTALPTDYSITSSSPCQLLNLNSEKCWWEIGAVFELLQRQSKLVNLVFDGAVMDREWEGSQIISHFPTTTICPHLVSLQINEIMHEDTLQVLLRCTPSLTSLRIGFQSIGPTDDDTPPASIPTALKFVSTTLRHFALKSPSKASEDTIGLLESCLDVLPVLEILEFSEQGVEAFAVPISSTKFFDHLPKSLRILRARGIISFSTGKLLTALSSIEAIPVLEEIDMEWAEMDLAFGSAPESEASEGRKEGKWKERHRSRIQERCESLGIRCSIAKGDGILEFKEALKELSF